MPIAPSRSHHLHLHCLILSPLSALLVFSVHSLCDLLAALLSSRRHSPANWCPTRTPVLLLALRCVRSTVPRIVLFSSPLHYNPMPRGAGGSPVARAATRRLRRRARAHTALRRGVLDGGESLRPSARGAARAARVVGRAHRAEVTATHFSLLPQHRLLYM